MHHQHHGDAVFAKTLCRSRNKLSQTGESGNAGARENRDDADNSRKHHAGAGVAKTN